MIRINQWCIVCDDPDVVKSCAQIGCRAWFCHEHTKLAKPENCWRAVLRGPVREGRRRETWEEELMGNIIDKETGQEFEPVYGMDGTHRLEPEGIVPMKPNCKYGMPTLRLIHPRHTQGGIEFEETGEKRKPNHGEWYMVLAQVQFQHGCANNHTGTYRIARPVAIKET